MLMLPFWLGKCWYRKRDIVTPDLDEGWGSQKTRTGASFQHSKRYPDVAEYKI